MLPPRPNIPQIPALPPPDAALNSDVGGTDTGFVTYNNAVNFVTPMLCTIQPHAAWGLDVNTGQSGCYCVRPYFGPSCTREAHTSTYYGAGTPTPQDMTALGIPSTAPQLAFAIPTVSVNGGAAETSLSCTAQCDAMEGCKGVIWASQNRCDLLMTPVEVPAGRTISYSPDTDATLYLKRGIHPQFTDRVFVYTGSLPLRFWVRSPIRTEGTQLQAIARGEVVKLNFKPTHVLNDTSLVGVFSSQPFAATDIANVNVSDLPPEQFSIQHGSTDLNLPNWSAYWATYI